MLRVVLVAELQGSEPPKTRKKKEKISWFRGYRCLQRKKKNTEESNLLISFMIDVVIT